MDGNSAPDANRTVGPDRASTRRPPVAGRPRILIAEDDDDARELLAMMLRGAGYAVAEASNGLDAVAQVRDKVIARPRRPGLELVVSDIQLPGCSGLDLLWVVHNAGFPVPVILVTAWDDSATSAEARRLGARAILRKPLDPSALAVAVAAALRPATRGKS